MKNIKGLILLILLFFAENQWAQNKIQQVISSDSEKIYIELGVIDHLEIITTSQTELITISSESDKSISTNFVLEDKNGMILIKEAYESIELYDDEINKFCKIQPNYKSVKISIPSQKTVYANFNKGNFYANNFTGDLNLKLNDGIVRINKFEGSVNIEIEGGKVFCHRIENININAVSNMGFVSANWLKENPNRIRTVFKGVLGEKRNDLKVKAISANIHLKAK